MRRAQRWLAKALDPSGVCDGDCHRLVMMVKDSGDWWMKDQIERKTDEQFRNILPGKYNPRAQWQRPQVGRDG